jgi:hypothetical protein
MDIKAIVDQVLVSSKVVNTELNSWNFEHVIQLSIDVAVLVMKQTVSSSKDVNAVLIASVVSDVLDHVKSKGLSSVAQEKSTEVCQKFDMLKLFVSEGLPVVLSRLPLLNVPYHFRDCFSFCKRVSSAVKPDVNLAGKGSEKISEIAVNKVEKVPEKVAEVAEVVEVPEKVADVEEIAEKIAEVVKEPVLKIQKEVIPQKKKE